MTDRVPVDALEPNAQQRTAARELYMFFVALVQQGFTEAQALTLVGNLLESSDEDGD